MSNAAASLTDTPPARPSACPPAAVSHTHPGLKRGFLPHHQKHLLPGKERTRTSRAEGRGWDILPHPRGPLGRALLRAGLGSEARPPRAHPGSHPAPGVSAMVPRPSSPGQARSLCSVRHPGQQGYGHRGDRAAAPWPSTATPSTSGPAHRAMQPVRLQPDTLTPPGEGAGRPH